jgi:hypothetical protein
MKDEGYIKHMSVDLRIEEIMMDLMKVITHASQNR